MTDCIAAAPHLRSEITLFFGHLAETVREFPYAASWIKDLKARGYRVYLLSNYGKTVYGLTHKGLSFLPLVDGQVFSYQVKSVKPVALIYQTLLDTYGLAPEECLFFDDSPRNVEGAKRVGINAHLFATQEDAEAALRRYTQEE